MKKLTFSGCSRWQKPLASKDIFSFLLLFVLMTILPSKAQTVLVNPNAEGGFENGATFTDNGWTTVSATTNNWSLGTVPGWFTGNRGAYVSNDAGTTWGYTNNTANRSSFYRDVTFPANIASITLNFDWRANGNDGNYDNLLVYIVDTAVTPTTAGPTGTNTTTTGWTGYTNGTTGYFLLQRNGTTVPTSTTAVSYTFSAAQTTYVAGSTKRLVFVWKNDGSGGTNPPAAVDNISLVAFTCNAPSALVTSAFTSTTATVNWTAPTSAPANGYEYEVRTSGTVGSGATGLFTSGTTTGLSLPLTGLDANTSYTYYVRSVCGTNDFSQWVSNSFYTGYCVPSSTSTATYINNFSTTGGSTNISNLASGYTTGGYQNNFNTATVSQYATGTINFASDIVGGSVGTSIWVDWNNDLVFDNATERVFVTTAYGYNQTGSFVVPNGTALGDYRMRIRIDYNAIAPDACANTNTRTEAEDYKLTVVAPPACLAPIGLTAAANTAFTATLNWTASVSNPSAGYEYYFATTNTAPTAGTTPSGSVGAGILTASISGLTPTTIYYVWVRSNCGSGILSDWSLTAVSFTTPCNPPTITGTTPGSVCGQGSAVLGATSSEGNIKWYAAATGGGALGTGATFNTPSINATTSFWVEASVSGSTQTSGKSAPAAAATTSTSNNWGIVFNATAPVELQSVSVYSTSAGTINIKVTNAALTELYATGNIAVAAGGTTTPNVIPLNFSIPAGTGYRILVKASSGISLVRDNSGVTFPYNGTDDVLNVTSSEWGGTTTTNYYYFYDVKYSSVCASPRTEVVATVTTPPTLTLSATNAAICPGTATDAVTLTAGASDYDTYTWVPTESVTGDAVNGWVFNPTVNTNYTLTASQSSGALCQTTAGFSVLVNPSPIISASATNTTICEGSGTSLNANDFKAIGTATTLTVQTEQPTAFCNRWDQYWNQTIFTAAELQAAGLTAGNITSIAYTITTLGSGTNVTNFSVRIGTTTNNTVSAFQTTGLTTVYGPATYTHAVGVNTITFDTPYVWDGTSNIVLDIRQDGADSTNNAITYYTATAQNMTISATTGTDSAVTTLQDLVAANSTSATVATSLRRLNVVFGASASAVTWSWNPGALNGNTVWVAPTETTTYTVTATNTVTTCTTQATVEIVVNPAPAPTGASVQIIEVVDAAEATIADLVVTGNDLAWYASEEDAIDDINPLALTTQLVSGNTYYVVSSSPEGCRSIPFAVTVTVTLGNSSFDLAGLKLYPNPTNNILNVEYTNTITSIEVYNLVGQRIDAKNVNAISTTVDMSHLAKGTYFVKVQAENAARTIKVMKN